MKTSFSLTVWGQISNIFRKAINATIMRVVYFVLVYCFEGEVYLCCGVGDRDTLDVMLAHLAC